ncbi:hypothetical protein FisN_12Lu387 [Fistulifera solaris]|uniref:Myb-like domain-containing protein n=1 Tax=Fistulifera solaris TaxID=1519565 RepID=A0A1Z5JM47_FISSO|nr:hypothetical protein FisN_12Lu387 [Fistulifera solaris]|eukprot:GAX15085.1 hypothetical protein FisN_12Lu387 [Fistulifera solaris]
MTDSFASDEVTSDQNSLTPEKAQSSDGLATLFRNSLDISDKSERLANSREKHVKKTKNIRRPKRPHHSDSMGLESLMERLSIASPKRNDRIWLPVSIEDVPRGMFKNEKQVFSPSLASVPKKQDRKKTPNKSGLSKLVDRSNAVVNLNATLQVSPAKNCAVRKQSYVELINSDPSGGIAKESGDQIQKETLNAQQLRHPTKRTKSPAALENNDVESSPTITEPSCPAANECCDHSEKQTRRSQRSRKPTNFFHSIEENVLTSGTIRAKDQPYNPAASSCNDPSPVDRTRKKSSSSRKESTRNEKPPTSPVIDPSLKPLEDCNTSRTRDVKVAEPFAHSHNSDYLNCVEPALSVKRSKRNRKPTAFYTPSARSGSSPDIPADEGLSDEVTVNSSSRLEASNASEYVDEKVPKKKSDPNLESDENDLKRDEVSTNRVNMPAANGSCSLTNNDNPIELKGKTEWLPVQLEQLKHAHRQSNPMSGTFWDQVAAAVDGKSPGQCREQWYSLIKTPVVKVKPSQTLCNPQRFSNDDDLFDSTPMRNTADPPKMKPSLLNIYAGIRLANKKVAVTNVDSSDEGLVDSHVNFFQPKIGYKTYLQGMKRDISKESKNQKKGRKVGKKGGSKGLHAITGSIRDLDVDMTARLTPGGSFRYHNRNHDEHQDDDDDWDDQMNFDN